MTEASTVTIGDHVRVEYEGIYHGSRFGVARDGHYVTFDTDDGQYTATVPGSATVTVLAKPATVGDRLVPCKSIAVMHALRDGAVLAAVARPAELVIKKNDVWFESGDDQPYDVQWMTAERTIVYLPE